MSDSNGAHPMTPQSQEAAPSEIKPQRRFKLALCGDHVWTVHEIMPNGVHKRLLKTAPDERDIQSYSVDLELIEATRPEASPSPAVKAEGTFTAEEFERMAVLHENEAARSSWEGWTEECKKNAAMLRAAAQMARELEALRIGTDGTNP